MSLEGIEWTAPSHGLRSRLTTPIVGMALVFMGLVIYPALSFS
jgi:hypothetical protein